jgi:membrane peptidoglycan carboxypeptidase
MPLGTQEVFPIDMAAAFASIAADGLYYPPYYIDRVEDRDGKVIFTHAPNPRRAESPESARLAADILEKNVQSGTGGKARIPNQHAAGKTGTAQNSGNGWFVGFTPYLSTAVWIGSPADNFEVRIRGTGITGGSYPAEIWGRYMRAWHEGLETADYKDPPKTRSGRRLQLERKIDRNAGFTPRRTPSRRSTATTRPRSATTESPDTTDSPGTTEVPWTPGDPDPPTTDPPVTTPTTGLPP